MNNRISLLFGGDTMLGRGVNEAIGQYGPEFPLGQIAKIMAAADVTIINLECAITNSSKHWSGDPKAFYFGAPLAAIKSLTAAGVDLVSLANNHILDFDYQGLTDSLQQLTSHNIAFTGAGENLQEALQAAIVAHENYQIGMVGFCDHQEDFAATHSKAGMTYLDLTNKEKSLSQFETSLQTMLEQQVNWPILSLHWGPNMVETPADYFIELAHGAIDMGYKIIFGHSAHIFHGIEIYKDCPIIYAAGDLVDDYYIDPYFKNDHQLLFEIILEDFKIKDIILYPVFLEYCYTRLAIGEEFEYIKDKMQGLCQRFHLDILMNDDKSLKVKL